MARAARELTTLLADQGLTHLAVTKRGSALTVVSGPDADPEIRIIASDADSWRLEVADHRGRWEATPFEGDLAELVDAALSIGRLEEL
jgi:hypothetical protein